MEIIVGNNAGFCYGVERAVNEAKEQVSREKIYCLGEIVHNRNVINNLKQHGITFIDNIEEAKGKTIIRAHGVPKQIYEKAGQMKIELVDLTCPSVLKIHKLAEEYSKKGYFIILTGKREHPEIIGIESYCGKKYKNINTKEELITSLEEIKKEKNILLISQTTYNSKKFDIIQQILKENLNKDVNYVVKKTICPSTEIRQQETEQLAKNVDLMIIIGDKKSSNTNKLYDISCNFCNKVMFISDINEIDTNKIEHNQKIGIMAGASTPKEDILKVKEFLSKI